MGIKKQIRTTLVRLLTEHFASSDKPQVAQFFASFPQSLFVSDDPNEADDLPAVAVAIPEGNLAESLDGQAAILTIRIYASMEIHNMVDILEAIEDEIKSLMGDDFDCNGLLENCAYSGFAHAMDDEMPWGTLDLNYNIDYLEG